MKKFWLRAGLVLMGCTGLLSASPIVIPVNSGGLSGSATFNFSNGGFTVTLLNTTPTLDAADLLTDLIFNLSGTTSNVTLTGTAGQLVNVDATGAVTNVSGTAGWGFGTYTGGTFNGEFLLCTICGAGVTETAANASQGILGPGTGSGSTPYSTANGSIDGNGAHNPFYSSAGATFSFTGTGITSATTVSNVFFSFGTAFGVETPGGGGGGGGATPEPASMMLFGGGFVALGMLARKRQAVK